ncbi:MAG: hypothetical protein MUC88_00425 [Planctomycetes bacterium]|jgi:hypothetical protein|nr:hypothetical protein [Planctomycetota bacterium]
MKQTRIINLTDQQLFDWACTFDREEIAALAPWLPEFDYEQPAGRPRRSITPLQLLELYIAWAEAVGWRLVSWASLEHYDRWAVTLSGESLVDPAISKGDRP